MIHPTAIVHPKAKLDPTVRIGAYSVIDEDVEIGPQNVLGPYVHMTGRTTIGSHNQFHAGCVIGDAPQDLKYRGEPTRLCIGDHNVFREHVTVHRSTEADKDTRVGSHNFFMASAHVGHNAQVGNHVILANSAALGGYAVVQDRAFLSANCLVHQFVRVGTLTMMQGNAAVSQDLPPFTMVHRVNEMCGLNTVGLRRAGYSPADRMELKRLYHALFRQGRNLRSAVDAARATFTGPAAILMLDFVASTKRGVCSDSGMARGSDSEKAGEAG